jgi:hypothetical protein
MQDGVSAVAEKNAELEQLADEDDTRSDQSLITFRAGLDALGRVWLEAADWPPHVVGIRNRLVPRLGLGTVRQGTETPLWCWYGPAVPRFLVTSGLGRPEGPDSWKATPVCRQCSALTTACCRGGQ